jgi:hypothetical protein
MSRPTPTHTLGHDVDSTNVGSLNFYSCWGYPHFPYIQPPKNRFDCLFGLRICDNRVGMPHVTCTLHDPATHISFLSLSRDNLWSYTLCSFLQFPITFNHESLWTDQHCSQTQSTVFLQCQWTRFKTQLNRHMFILQYSVSERSKTCKGCKTLRSCSVEY